MTKPDWVAAMYAYYKALPYHDEVIFWMDGERIVLPKKMYDIEGLNKKLQEQGLDPVLIIQNLSAALRAARRLLEPVDFPQFLAH